MQGTSKEVAKICVKILTRDKNRAILYAYLLSISARKERQTIVMTQMEGSLWNILS